MDSYVTEYHGFNQHGSILVAAVVDLIGQIPHARYACRRSSLANNFCTKPFRSASLLSLD